MDKEIELYIEEKIKENNRKIDMVFADIKRRLDKIDDENDNENDKFSRSIV